MALLVQHRTNHPTKSSSSPCLAKDDKDHLEKRLTELNLHNGAEETDNFLDFYSQIRQDILEHPEHSDVPSANDWLANTMDFNALKENHTRGKTVKFVFEHFAKNPTEDELKLSHIMGWFVELILSSFRISTNLIDNRKIHHGNVTWHEKNNRGSMASNDSILLLSAGHYILEKYFGSDDKYLDYKNIVTNVSKYKSLGKCVELRTNLEDEMSSGSGNYDLIVKYEKSYFNFYFPIAIGMTMAGVSVNSKIHKSVEKILLKIGSLYQVITDYRVGLDENTTGIDEKRLTWMLYEALRLASPKDKLIIQQNYGKPGQEHVRAVLRIYDRLDIKSKCENHIVNLTNEIKKGIGKMPEEIPKIVFYDILDFVLSKFN